jgi:hypothetical protein
MEFRMRLRTIIGLSGLAILLGPQASLGQISLSQLQAFPISPNPDYMVAGDLNSDGLTDVVTVSTQSDEVNALLADPGQPSGFAAVGVGSIGTRLRKHTLGDLNSDGVLDLAVTDQRAEGVWVLLGTGTGRFGSPTFSSIGRSPFAVVIRDFDGVRGNDMAVADEQLNNVSILLNDGGNPPRFSRGPIFAVGDQPRSLVAVDLNDDGEDDLVTLNEGGRSVKSVSVLIYEGVSVGLPVFSRQTNFGVGANPSSLTTGDFNDDGLEDLVMVNKPRNNANSEINILTNVGNGTLIGPTGFSIPCPFLSGRQSCRANVVVSGDVNDDFLDDLTVLMSDPRETSSVGLDAMQVFSGRGAGNFAAGPVLTTPKKALSGVAADINGDGLLDIVAGFQRTSNVAAFINTSTPGGEENGSSCFIGDECLSGRCTNGYCCNRECDDNEICDVLRREGECLPLVDPKPCGDASECESDICADGYCCDASCENGRCDVEFFEGLCIPAFADGDECFEDMDCQSGFCSDETCCRERCDEGYCGDADGICRTLRDIGAPCDADGECSSEICDVFEGVCCSEICLDTQDCNTVGNPGNCVDIPPPEKRPDGDTCTNADGCISGNCLNGVCCGVASCGTGQVCLPPDGTCGSEPTPIPEGEYCTGDAQCDTGNCVNFVCCFDPVCDEGEACMLETGLCMEGPPPPTPTPTPTRIPTTPPSTPTPVECGDFSCDAGFVCAVDDSGPYCASLCGGGQCVRDEVCSADLCVKSSRSGGCAIERGGSLDELWFLALLPVALLLSGRRDQLLRPILARARR